MKMYFQAVAVLCISLFRGSSSNHYESSYANREKIKLAQAPVSTNISKGKKATQSCNYNESGYNHASAAVDGNTDGDLNSNNHSVAATCSEKNVWWSVYLGEGPFTITGFTVWNRTDCCSERIKGGKLEIFNKKSESDKALLAWVYFTDTRNSYTYTSSVQGNYIVISKPDGYINIAEVEVFGYLTPTQSPTQPPTKTPTKSPTKPPTKAPTNAPTKPPTKAPTKSPTNAPTTKPTTPPAPKTYENDWKLCFDDTNWCNVNGFMTGMYRNENGEDGIDCIDKAESADAPFNLRGGSSCYKADWYKADWKSFAKVGGSLCNNGYYMRGMHRKSKRKSKNDGGEGGQGLHLIDKANCCKPNAQKGGWGTCYDLNVGSSFDSKGWSKCATGSYMAGFYRSNCDNLYCIERFKCCKMGSKKAYYYSPEDIPEAVNTSEV